MYDDRRPAGPTQGTHQRARGTARAGFGLSRGATRLTDLHQSGSAKALLPRTHSRHPEVVFLNTAGGLTGGDVFSYEIALGAGTRAVATTQTAERAYAALDEGPPAKLGVTLDVGQGAHLDWLPQETILFDRARLNRRTEIRLAREASCLLVEMIVLGRAAMGEALARTWLDDRRIVTREGGPVFIEPLRITDAVLGGRDRPALLDGARAMATVALIADGAEDGVEALRAQPAVAEVDAAVSGWDGRLIARAVAADAFPLRRWVAATLGQLRAGQALPRVWQL